MNINDLTPEQDTAFVELRRLHNKSNPDDQVTKAQLVQRYATHAFQTAITEASNRVSGTELRTAYEAANSTVKGQVRTILGI